MTQVVHQPEQQRFVIELDAGEAVLEYQLLAANGVDFSRTYVPFSARGRGHAEKLVREGLAWAGGQQLVVQASCWYVRKFL